MGAAAAYHMWKHSEEPLPEPATQAVRSCASKKGRAGGTDGGSWQLARRLKAQALLLAGLQPP